MSIEIGDGYDLISVLLSHAKDFPDRVAYRFLGEDGANSLTYKELNDNAKSIGIYLKNKISIGERLLLLYQPGLDFIVAFLGCLYAGVVAVPVHCPDSREFKKSEALLKVILEDSAAQGILTTESLMSVIKENLNDFLLGNNIFVLETTNIIQSKDAIDNFYISKKPESIAYLQYTSGSTSNPKGVVFRHKHLNHTLKYTGEAWHYSQDSIALHWAPHSHAYGLLYGVLTPIYFGALSILMSPALVVRAPLKWLMAITRYRVTHSGAPNFGYELSSERIDQDECSGLELSCWKVAVVTAEPVQYGTLHRFLDKFRSFGFSSQSFFPTYGMSEAGVIASKPYTEPFTKFHLDVETLKANKAVKVSTVNEQVIGRDFVASGNLLFDFKAKIVDPQTFMLRREGEIGEIWLSGSSVTDGYWKKENKEIFEARLENDESNYFRTGDLGFIQDGNIILTGRLKELIIVYGKNYYPLDFEVIAKSAHDSIKNCASAVFSVRVEEKDGIILVQEIANETSLIERGNIIKSVRQTIAEKEGVDLYGVVLVKGGTIPKTSSGKIQRKLCEKRYVEGQLDIVQENYKDHDKPSQIKGSFENIFNGAEDEILLKKLQGDVTKIISDALKIETNRIDLNDKITRYGIDSLNAAGLISTLNKTYALRLRSTALIEQDSIALFCSDLLDQYKNNIRHYYKIMSEVEPA